MAEPPPDLSTAQLENYGFFGSPDLAWRDEQVTQKLVKWLRFNAGVAQDAWLDGAYTTWESNLIAQGGAKRLLEVAVMIENIKLEEPKPQKEQESE